MRPAFCSVSATYYDVRITTDARQLQTRFHEATPITPDMLLAGQLYSPAEFGARESLRVSLVNSSRESVYYMAVQAYNMDMKGSAPSNIIMFIFSLPKEKHVEKILGIPHVLFFILLVLIIVTLLVLLLLISLLVYRRLQQKQSKADQESVESYEEVTGANPADTVIAPAAAPATASAAAPAVTSTANHGSVAGSKHSSRRSRITAKIRRSQGLLNFIASKASVSSRSNAKGLVARKAAEQGNQGNHGNQDKPWLVPDEPLQDHSYSNKLFGESALNPEVELENSVIYARPPKKK